MEGQECRGSSECEETEKGQEEAEGGDEGEGREQWCRGGVRWDCDGGGGNLFFSLAMVRTSWCDA